MAVHVYLETEPGSGVFHWRGECGPGDDPQGFKRAINRGRRPANRLRVVLKDRHVGDSVKFDAADELVAEAPTVKNQTKGA